MTGRTHDLVAFSSLSYVFLNQPFPHLSLATLIVAVGANLIGGLFPDLDKASSDFWEKIPGGSFFGKLLAPFLGGHRLISHSLLGVFLSWLLLTYLAPSINTVLLVDLGIVINCFIIGYISHLAADLFTKEGVPLLFPIPIEFGIPPFKSLRLTTGSKMEKYLIYPSIFIFTIYQYWLHYPQLISFLKNNIH